MSPTTLRESLASVDPRRRRAALERLAADDASLDDETLDAVIDCLGVPDKAVQRLAADVVARLSAGARGAALARLRTAMHADDAQRRWGALYALGRLGQADAAMVPPLVEALGGADGDRRWASATLLVACARVVADVTIPALVGAAVGTDCTRRKMALYAMRDAAPQHPKTRTLALRGLDDSDTGVRFAALAALVRIVPPPTEACPRVVEIAHGDVDAGVRRAALCTLGAIGRGVSAAEDAIAAAAASDDPLWQRTAAIARRRLGS